MQDIETILNTIKERNLNVSELSRNTGIPGTRIYKWLEGKGKPKVPDAEKLGKWASQNSELFPHLGESTPAPAAPLSPDQILSVLAIAYQGQVEIMKAQTTILEAIKKEMARETTQARIEDKLEDILSGVENLSVRQKQILDGTYGIDRKSRVVKPRSAAGSGKKQH